MSNPMHQCYIRLNAGYKYMLPHVMVQKPSGKRPVSMRFRIHVKSTATPRLLSIMIHQAITNHICLILASCLYWQAEPSIFELT